MSIDARGAGPAWEGLSLAPLLVGRPGEMARLGQLLRATKEGGGGAVLIHGAAGIGKTRLLTEAGSLASSGAFHVLTGRCQEMDRGTPYSPWIQVLRAMVARSPKRESYHAIQPNRGAVVRLVPELDDRIWMFDPDAVHGSELDSRGFLEGIARVFLTLGRERPTLILLDDLGWADAGTLDLLLTVCRSSTEGAVAVVAAYRDSHVAENPALGRFLAAVRREHLATELVPEPLTDVELGQMIRSATGDRDVGPIFRRAVFRRSGGNPFFVLEILQSLADSGVLLPALKADRLDLTEQSVPESVREVITHRLDRLDESARQTLRIASLLGVAFSVEPLESVVGTDEDSTLRALDVATRLQLIAPTPLDQGGAAYTFTHPLIQDVLAAEVSPTRAQRIHLKAAKALEAHPAGSDDLSPALAYHFRLANEWEPALRFTIQAAHRAARLFAHTDAIDHYRAALGLLRDHPHPSTSAEILEALSGQLSVVGDYAGAVRCLTEASDLQRQLGNPLRAIGLRTQAVMYGPFTYREYRRIEDQLQQARSLLEAAPPSPDLARLYVEHGTMLADRFHMIEGRDLLSKAIEVAAQVHQESLEAEARVALALLLPLDARDDIPDLLRPALAATTASSPAIRLRVLHALALFSAYGAADMTQAVAWVESANATPPSEEAADLLDTTNGGVGTFALLARGELQQGARAAEQYRNALSDRGRPASSQNLMMLAWAATDRGDFESAGRLLEEAHNNYTIEEGWFFDPWFWFYHGYLDAARSEWAVARTAFQRCLTSYNRRERLAIDSELDVRLRTWLVTVAAELQDLSSMSVHIAALRDLAQKLATPSAQAHLARAEGISAAASGEMENALKHHQQAVKIWSRLGWTLERAREMGNLARLADRMGDHPSANRWRSEARAAASAAGAHPGVVRWE